MRRVPEGRLEVPTLAQEIGERPVSFPRICHAAASRPSTAFAAARMTSITKSGWESMGTWLLASSVVVAPMRLAKNRSRSGWTVRSFSATMNQLGFDFHAVPSTF